MHADMEMPAPLAATYLLSLPDHYTSHSFTFIFVKYFINNTALSQQPQGATAVPQGDQETTEYNIESGNTGFILVNQYIDYINRPAECEDMSVVEFFCLTEKVPKVCLVVAFLYLFCSFFFSFLPPPPPL
jgi:hypothetical protein